MSDPNGENLGQEPGKEKPGPDDAQKAIHRNLNSFLNPAFRAPPKKAPDPNGALQLRMAQMELANKMRLQKSQPTESSSKKAVPARPNPPPGGFGSAQGVFHMQRGNFGQKASRPTASKRSPYQQVLANASAPEKPETSTDEPKVADNGQEVIDVPLDAEVKQNEKPKRPRGKRFRNPSL